jgi:aminopeptidase N
MRKFYTLLLLLHFSFIGFAQQNSKDSLAQPSQNEIIQDSIRLWLTPKGSYNPEVSRKFDLQHTKLEVSFDWTKQHLLGIATLTMNPLFYPQDEIILDAKGFDIHSIELLETKNTVLKYDYDKRKLKIKLPKTYTKTEKLTIKISYTAKPNELENIGNEVITSDKGLYFINPVGKETGKPQQIWTQGETEASSCWFPTFDSPNIKNYARNLDNR